MSEGPFFVLGQDTVEDEGSGGATPNAPFPRPHRRQQKKFWLHIFLLARAVAGGVMQLCCTWGWLRVV